MEPNVFKLKKTDKDILVTNALGTVTEINLKLHKANAATSIKIDSVRKIYLSTKRNYRFNILGIIFLLFLLDNLNNYFDTTVGLTVMILLILLISYFICVFKEFKCTLLILLYYDFIKVKVRKNEKEDAKSIIRNVRIIRATTCEIHNHSANEKAVVQNKLLFYT